MQKSLATPNLFGWTGVIAQWLERSEHWSEGRGFKSLSFWFVLLLVSSGIFTL